MAPADVTPVGRSDGLVVSIERRPRHARTCVTSARWSRALVTAVTDASARAIDSPPPPFTVLPMPNARTDAADIGYAEHGHPDGTPVVLVHGFPDSAATWDGVVGELRQDRLRLIIPDLRGYGDTRLLRPDDRDGSEVALGQDVADLIAALGLDRPVVVGHDWGARATYVAAALYPERVRAIVTMASAYMAYGGRRPLPPAAVRGYWYQWYFDTSAGEEALRADRVAFCRYLWQAWSPQWAFAEADFDRASRAWDRPEFVDLVLHAYRAQHGTSPVTPRYQPQAAAFAANPPITVPCWFAAGMADQCDLPPGGLDQERWFHAGYVRHELPAVGHFVQREAPAVVADLIRRATLV